MEILFIRSRISRLQCSIIDVNKQTNKKLAKPQNWERERKLNSFYDISVDLEGLFGAPFYFLAEWELMFHSIFVFSHLWRWNIAFQNQTLSQHGQNLSHTTLKKRNISTEAFFLILALACSIKYHLWLPSMEGLCICFNTMVQFMVEFHFGSNFPRQFWDFAVPWKRSNEKKCAKCRAGICFILYE